MRNLKGLLVGMTVGILMVCIFVTIFSPRYKASKLLSTDLPHPVATQWSDNHGGFFGDGELYGTLIFNESNKKALDEHLLKNGNWHSLPLPEDLGILLYGGEKHGSNYEFRLADGWDAPKVTKGYYYFLDRLHNTTMDNQLLEASSLDVTVGLYDSERGILYVMTCDT